ncbi:MAG TPA: hypothetical protein VD947_04195, partial [Patescibacteria group bacterium]|nr:hypothetical protein [Patescibacteria group bacterium]
MRKNESGIAHIIIVLVLCLVIGVIGFAGYKVVSQQSDKSNNDGSVKWAFDEQKLEWFAQNGKAPACKEPFKFDRTPVDISQVTGVLMPGAYRGYSYKPHGGFGVPE